jgi:hypothetical protein
LFLPAYLDFPNAVALVLHHNPLLSASGFDSILKKTPSRFREDIRLAMLSLGLFNNDTTK